MDDLELFPTYKVRDVFVDISHSQAADKSFSTVKVYRNPPTSAELADPRRLESLPPDSLARPQKRPLPLLSDTKELDEHGRPPRSYSPVQAHGDNKRIKVEAFEPQAYLNPDRPLESLEVRDGDYDRSRAASQRPSPSRQVAASQKRKRELIERQKSNAVAETFQGSDPYGTPISSQIASHGLDKPHEKEVISIPDSPEISTVRSPLSPSQERALQIPLPNMLPPPNQQHEAHEKANTSSSLPPPEASKTHISEAQESGTTKTSIPESALKNERLDDSTVSSGRLRRPRKFKPSLAPKRTRKVINGVKQKVPSIFDPIESSEGSSYEREQLRSVKRLKPTTPSCQTSKSKEIQAKPDSKSPGSHLLLPHTSKSDSAAAQPEINSNIVQPKSYQQTKTTSPRGIGEKTTPTTNTNELSNKPRGIAEENLKQPEEPQISATAISRQGPSIAKGPKLSKQPVPSPKSNQDIRTKSRLEYQRNEQHPGQGSANNANTSPGQSKSPEYDDFERQKEEELETKRRAQAEFDRIAAMGSTRKPTKDGNESNTARIQQKTATDLQANHESESSSSNSPSWPQPPVPYASMSFTERREWNMQHIVPVRMKQYRDFNAKLEEFGKEERAAQAEVYRQQKQARAQQRKEAKTTAKKRAAKDQRAEDQPAKTGRAAMEDSDFMDLPQPTRIKPKQAAQRKEPSVEDVPNRGAQKGPLVIAGEQMVETGADAQAQTQAMSNRASPRRETSLAEGSQSKVVTENLKPASQQGVCNSDQSWLFDRSPKAKYNAQRQLELANQWLKQKKRAPTAPNPRAVVTLAAAEPTSRMLAAQKKAQPRENGVKKQHHEEQDGVERHKATTGTFTDSEALRAAGLRTDLPSASTTVRKVVSKPSTSNKAIPIANAKAIRNVPAKPQLPGILEASGPRSSSPTTEQSGAVRNRSMTPAIPGSSSRGSTASTEVKTITLKRAATVAPEAAKTTIEDGLRATPDLSRRSVSFADDLLPSSQSRDLTTKPTKPSGVKTGLLQRAIEESKAKRLEEIKGWAKSAASGASSTKPPTKGKQTKMTQHINHLSKGKGKATDFQSEDRIADREPSIHLSSSDEADTYFSDESEGERCARAGPSSRKKAKPILNSAKSNCIASDKRQETHNAAKKSEIDLTRGPGSTAISSNPGKRPTAPPATSYGARVRSKDPGPGATSAASSGDTITITSSSSTTYSDSEIEHVLSQTDDISLLPRVDASGQSLSESGQLGGQKSAAVVATSSQPHFRSSVAPEPSSTPKHERHDAQLARLTQEARLSQEADRQLQREHQEAVRRGSSAKAPSVDPSKDSQPRGRRTEGNRATTTGFEHTSLSKLRQAQVQAATEPVDMQKARTANRPGGRSPPAVELSSSSDSASDNSSIDTDKMQQASQGPCPSKRRNPFSKVFAELFGPKK